jgi:alkylation response protein AidB-like acyl-CoA dehydrogenase
MSDLEDMRGVHDELRAVARDLLGKASAPDWRLLADAGWLGLEVPEALGGAGATFAEVAVILEEMGRAATSGPYLGTVVLGVGALRLLASTPGRDELLRDVASGDRRLAVALPTGDDTTVPFRIEGGRLHGRAEFVPDAPDADVLLVLALDPAGEPVVVPAAPDAVDGAVAVQPVLDATRRFGVVTADGVAVDEVWGFAGDPAAAVGRLHDRAALAVACDSLGLGEAMLDATVAYARARH